MWRDAWEYDILTTAIYMVLISDARELLQRILSSCRNHITATCRFVSMQQLISTLNHQLDMTSSKFLSGDFPLAPSTGP